MHKCTRVPKQIILDYRHLSLQGYSAAGHCTVRIFCGSALLGDSAVGHYRDSLWFGMRLGTLAMRGYFADILRLGAAGIFCGWARQGYLAIRYFAARHCPQGEENIDVLKSHNVTVRLRKEDLSSKGLLEAITTSSRSQEYAALFSAW